LAKPVNLETGDILLLGTDGIWEARNPLGEMFKTNRLRQLVATLAQKNARLIHDTIMAKVFRLHVWRTADGRYDPDGDQGRQRRRLNLSGIDLSAVGNPLVRDLDTQPRLGLALGSGAARGLAHIGVLKVLEEAKTPVHGIAGTSIGAFIGALYAAGVPVQRMETAACELDWRKLARLLNPTVPISGLVDGRKLVEFMAELLPVHNFEGLQLPLAVTATDIETGEALIIRKGDLLEALRAALAFRGFSRRSALITVFLSMAVFATRYRPTLYDILVLTGSSVSARFLMSTSNARGIHAQQRNKWRAELAS